MVEEARNSTVQQVSTSITLPQYPLLTPVLIEIVPANLPDSALEPYLATLTTGIYFGFASIHTAGTTPPTVYPMVMSLGWNPFYDNNRVVGEVHVLSKFTHDFYGEEMRVIILGFVRPEYNYTSLGKIDPRHFCHIER